MSLKTFAIGAALAAPVLALPALQGARAQAIPMPPIPLIEDLPAGAGRDEVFYTCTACHGLQIIKAQRLSRERWDEVIATMVTVNGLPPPTDAERTVLLDYLATAFPDNAADRPAFINPFLR